MTEPNVCLWHKADMPAAVNDVRFWGVKRTSRFRSFMSAFDPKRTFGASGVGYRAGLASPAPDRGTVPSPAATSLSRSDA
jgi:hypothetical protein